MKPPRLSISFLRQLGHKQPDASRAKGIRGNWAHQHESSSEHVITAPHRVQDLSITEPSRSGYQVRVAVFCGDLSVALGSSARQQLLWLSV
jgi:hypothetical protein